MNYRTTMITLLLMLSCGPEQSLQHSLSDCENYNCKSDIFSVKKFSAEERIPKKDDDRVSIESDTQTYDKATGIVSAFGNVIIRYPQKNMLVTCSQAQYFSNESRMVLRGNVKIVQEGLNTVEGEHVTYDVYNEKIVAYPAEGKQVRSSINL